MRSKAPDPSTEVIPVNTSAGTGKVEKERTQMWEWRAPIKVEFNFVDRMIVIHNSVSSDSPSVLTIPATFKGST